MKSTLRLKFIMLYIIFGFLSIFTVSLLSNQLLLNKLEQDSSQNMYRIANQTATSYLPSYFSNDLSAWSVHSQLQAMQLYLNASVWFGQNRRHTDYFCPSGWNRSPGTDPGIRPCRDWKQSVYLRKLSWIL